MLLFAGLLIVCCSLSQGQTPPNIIEFSEQNTGKLTLDGPNDVKDLNKGFKLLCKTDGSTPMTFSWTYNGNPLFEQRGITMTKTNDKPNEELLWVESVSPRDNGKYQCFAGNAYGKTFSRQLPVKVTYAADFRENEDIVKEVDVVVGEPLRLVCPDQNDGSNDFGVAHMWARKKGAKLATLVQKNHRVLLPNGDYLFLYLNQSDIRDISAFPDGTVQCLLTAGNQVYFSHQFKLKDTKKEKKRFGPTFQNPSSDHPKSQEQAIQGKRKKLFCAAVGYPAPSITWNRLNIDKTFMKKIEDGKDGFSVKDYGRSLIINTASKAQHEAGYYQCVASNGVGPDVKSPPIKLKVFIPPLWTEKPPKMLSVPIGSDGSLKCEALGIPKPSYKWYYNGTAFTSDDQLGPDIKVDGQYLRFPKMKQINHGIFQCAVKNDYGMLVSSTWVKFKATIPNIQDFGPFYLFKGTKATLKCVTNAAPRSVHTWFHDGKQLEMKDRYSTDETGSLIINNVINTDGGKYKCLAVNTIGKDEAEAEATVYERTSIVRKPPANVSIEVGKPLELQCWASADQRLNGSLKYKWLKDDALLRNGTDRLIIRKAVITDGGKYKCVAYTDAKQYSEDTATTVADVQGVPSPPYDLNITDCNDGTTRITWKKGNDNGSPITSFIVEQQSTYFPEEWQVIANISNPDAREYTLKLALWADLTFRMRSVNKKGPSRASIASQKGQCVTKQGLPTMFPQNLRGIPGKPGELDIAWTAMTKLQAGAPRLRYYLYHKKADADKFLPTVYITDPATERFTVPNAGNNVKWKFQIVAVNTIGRGPISDMEEALSGGQDVQTWPKTFPKNLRGIPGKAGELDIAWTAMTQLQAGAPGLEYVLYYKKADADKYAQEFINDPTTERFTVPNAGTHVKWEFMILAKNIKGDGPISGIENAFSGQDPPTKTPTDVKIDKVSTRSVELSWNRVDPNGPGNIDGYKIYYWVTKNKTKRRKRRAVVPSGASVFIANQTANNRQTATLSGLTPGSSYSLVLRAFNSGGQGPSSKVHSFDTKQEAENPFQVTCDKDNIEIALKSSEFGDGNFKTDTATLRDTNCKAKRLNSTHVYMETPLDDCGTYHNYSSDGRYVIYYNHIVLQRKSNEDSAVITRDHEAVFEFECRYHRSRVLSVVHFTPSRATVYTATENFGNFTFMMRMFKTKEYKEAYEEYPVYVIASQDVFIQTEVKTKDAELVLFVENCNATPSENRNDKEFYDLIEKGCPKDETLQYNHKLSPVQRFNFKAFYFNVDKQASVHIHCIVRVCRKADKNSRCVKGCSSRRRRAAPNANEENEISGTLTLGPIQRQTEARKGSSASSDSSPKMFVEMVVGVLGFFVVILLVAVTVVLLKKRQQQGKEVLSLIIDDSEH